MAEAGGESSQGKGVGDENWCVQAAVLGSISMCLFCFGFFRCHKQTWRVKPRADEQSERMRQLSAWSLSKSRESCISSVKHFSLVLQASCRLPLELDEHLR